MDALVDKTSTEELMIWYVVPALRRYLEFGLKPGSSTLAIIEGRLFAVSSRMDRNLRPLLFELTDLISNSWNQDLYGSPETVQKYITLKQERPYRAPDVKEELRALDDWSKQLQKRHDSRMTV